MWNMSKLHRTPTGVDWRGDVTTECGLSGSFYGHGTERTTSMYRTSSGRLFEAQSADNEVFGVTCNRCRFGSNKSEYITVYIKSVRVSKDGRVRFDGNGYTALSQKKYEEVFDPEVREVLDSGGVVMSERGAHYGYGRARMRPPSMSLDRKTFVFDNGVRGASG